MKPHSTLFAAVAAVVALSGCGSAGESTTSTAPASKRIDATGATRLDIAEGFDVRVSHGSPDAVTVSYDKDLADLLDVRLDGTTLRIHLRPRAFQRSPGTLRADVTINRLDEIRAAGASTVAVTGAVSDLPVRLTVAGSSRLAAELAVERADATVSGSSRLQLTGRADTLAATGSGASWLTLDNLRVHDLDISLSGASRGTVQADRTIAAEVSGASHLTCRGTPRFTKRISSGASTIESVAG
jgi:Putative auto-transporter adhesin, head GIN domain